MPTTPMISREPLVIAEKPDAPIACDLTEAVDTAQERFAEYGRLFAHALQHRERTADAVVLRFTSKPGVPDWIEDLVRREAACCPFFTHQVTFTSADVTWTCSSYAGPVAQTLLDEFYALPDRIGEGLDGMFARLGERGVALDAVEPGRYVIDERRGSRSLFGKLKSLCGC